MDKEIRIALCHYCHRETVPEAIVGLIEKQKEIEGASPPVLGIRSISEFGFIRDSKSFDEGRIIREIYIILERWIVPAQSGRPSWLAYIISPAESNDSFLLIRHVQIQPRL